MEQFRGITSVTDKDRRNAVKDEKGFAYTADGKKLIGYEGYKNKLVIKDGVEVITDEVFARMDIETVKLPNTVTHVGAYVFQDCPNLRSVTLSDNIVHLGEGAFFGCENLRKLDTNGTHNYLESDSFTLPSGIKQISDYTFCNCNSLDNPFLPNDLLRIGNAALKFSHIIKLTVPSSVIEIGNEAFCGCNWLTELSIPISILSMGSNVLKDCPNLKRINIIKGSHPRMKELLPEYENLFVEGDS